MVVLFLAAAGGGGFGYMQMQEASSLSAQVTDLQARLDQAQTELDALTKPVGDGPSPMLVMRQKAQELDAVKEALANGVVLSDLEAIVQAAKVPSAERLLGLGALRLLVKGKDDPGVTQAYEEAIKLMDIESRLSATCAAQAGMRAAGQKVEMLAECEKRAEMPKPLAAPDPSAPAAAPAAGRTPAPTGTPTANRAPGAQPRAQ